MSTIALQGLQEYLYSTLTPKGMRWVADHLVEHADQVEKPAPKRFTMLLGLSAGTGEPVGAS